MTKLYRATRASFGWLADVALAALLVGVWFVVGTNGFAVLTALDFDSGRGSARGAPLLSSIN